MEIKPKLVNALITEMNLRQDYLGKETINSIYFGGGTPSLLSGKELNDIFDSIFSLFEVHRNVEITLEANPDDLTKAHLTVLKAVGINRLSIGIQTFDNDRLKFINRAHSEKQALSCLEAAQSLGFDNITADLIYAIPPEDPEYWKNDLKQILVFDLPHLSIYGLTIEDRTVFGKWAKKGKLKEVKEEISTLQYQMAMDVLLSYDYEHYEVSNFARNNQYSRHNSAYWEDQKYLGIGPGAHSYNGTERVFNISHNVKYVNHLLREELPSTIEKLSEIDRVNEYLLTHLRTKKGVDLKILKEGYKKDLFQDYNEELDRFLAEKLITLTKNKLQLTSKGFMLADEISLRLFYDE